MTLAGRRGSGSPLAAATAAPRVDQPVGYIRGASGAMGGRGARRLAFWVSVLALITLVIVLASQAAIENSRLAGLRERGTPVEVTVTGCVAFASGTGITAAGYKCHGSFTLTGGQYDAVIRGTTSLLPVGSQITAVADPDNPDVLSTAITAGPSWTRFIPASIPLAIVSACLVAAAWRNGRRKEETALTRADSE